jgi:hypothetical protein
MAQVITFERFRPIARYDDIPWTEARIEEGATSDGPWVALETITLEPVDPDPTDPVYRNLTTELADDAFDLWYRIVFIDGTGDISIPTDPIQNSSPPTETGLYVTVAQVKSAADLLGETFTDSEIDIVIPAVCRAIDLYKKTAYFPSDQTRYYTAQAGATTLPIFDLNALTEVAIDDQADYTYATVWTADTDFFLEPANAAADGYPYREISLLNRSARFPTHLRGIRVTGSFGWAETPAVVKLAAEKLCVRELAALKTAPMGLIIATETAARIGSMYRDIADLLDNLPPRPKVMSLQLG